jgi:hypothetical protein
MGAKSLLIIAGVATITLIYLIYLAFTFEAPEGTTTIVIPPPVVRPLETATDPAVVPSRVVEVAPEAVQPAVEEQPVIEPPPVEVVVEEVAAEELVELPSLNNSDSFALDGLKQLQNGADLVAFLVDEQVIRRFVVLVDNVSKGTLPQSNLSYRAITGEMPVNSVDDNLFVMDESGFARFNQAVNAINAIDAGQAMALYRLFSPLFQQAYAELGYRDVNFDDTLRRAVRNVLDTDEIEGPFQLVKPSVMYLYADTNIESMEDVQKQIIRLGPENAEKLKTKMRQFMLQL